MEGSDVEEEEEEAARILPEAIDCDDYDDRREEAASTSLFVALCGAAWLAVTLTAAIYAIVVS